MTEQAEKLITGGCLCGWIRFEAHGPIDFPHVCSCVHCKRRSGAPMQAWIDVPSEGFRWTGPGGEPTWYRPHPDSHPKAKRGHCAKCGSNLAAHDDGDGNPMGLTIMCLDNDSIVPTHHSSKDQAVDWLPLVPWDGAADRHDQHAAVTR
jgi:hypothetical protein